MKMRLATPLSLGVKLLAMNAAGEILLVRQSYVPGLALPGGAVDPGETCAEAALREAREEAGLVVTGKPQLFNIYANRKHGNRNHVALFVAEGTSRDSAPRPNLEILSSGFFNPGALPDDVTDATRRRIAEVLNGAEVSDHW